MNEFTCVRSHKRYVSPENVGDVMVREKLEKYLSEREKLIVKCNIAKVSALENELLVDDFYFWWYKIDRSYINRLVKKIKSECKDSR